MALDVLKNAQQAANAGPQPVRQANQGGSATAGAFRVPGPPRPPLGDAGQLKADRLEGEQQRCREVLIVQPGDAPGFRAERRQVRFADKSSRGTCSAPAQPRKLASTGVAGEGSGKTYLYPSAWSPLFVVYFKQKTIDRRVPVRTTGRWLSRSRVAFDDCVTDVIRQSLFVAIESGSGEVRLPDLLTAVASRPEFQEALHQATGRRLPSTTGSIPKSRPFPGLERAIDPQVRQIVGAAVANAKARRPATVELRDIVSAIDRADAKHTAAALQHVDLTRDELRQVLCQLTKENES